MPGTQAEGSSVMNHAGATLSTRFGILCGVALAGAHGGNPTNLAALCAMRAASQIDLTWRLSVFLFAMEVW